MYLFDKFVVDPPKIQSLPEIISFDEKYLNKSVTENGYAFVIVDWLKIKIVDILSSRNINKLTSYFSSIPAEIRGKVKYITMDMYEPYLQIAKTYFNNAIVAIDSFHVLQNLIKAFEKVRCKYLHIFDNGSDELDDNDINYYLLKKYKDLFYKQYGMLEQNKSYNRKLKSYVSERSIIDMAIKTDSELEKAYLMLQEYLEFNRSTYREDAEPLLDYIIELFSDSGLNSFIEFSKTLCNWKEYILNSFIKIYDSKKRIKRRLSDGPIESINGIIKKIHLNANGFNNFTRLRKVIFFKINKDLAYKFNSI